MKPQDFTQNNGYVLKSVNVDGKDIPLTDTYTFENVIGAHTISATFEELVDNKLRIVDTYSLLQTLKMGLSEVSLIAVSDTFNEWEGKGIEIENPKQQNVTIVMPNKDAEVVIKHKPTLKLTLDEDLVIETEKTIGETINLSVTMGEGEAFGGWLAKGVDIDPMTLEQSFPMPDNNVEIILSKRSLGQGPLLKIELSEMTEIELEKTAGETITLNSSIIGDETFISWNVYGVEIDNPLSEIITFTMPSNDVYIKINQ